MRIEFHHVDAFTRRPFGGNPAGVCRLDEALDDATMQSIAAEFNLPATSFFWPDGDGFTLRWFAPAVELQLCGHGTLATGHVLLNVLEPERHGARFDTRAGALHVERDGDRIALDLPALPVHTQHPPEMAARALGVIPEALWEADRAMAVLADASQVRDLRPDFDAIAALPFPSVIVTAARIRRRLRLRFALLRAEVRNSGRLRHRLGALRHDAVLGARPRQDGALRAAAVVARRRALARGPRRPRARRRNLRSDRGRAR